MLRTLLVCSLLGFSVVYLYTQGPFLPNFTEIFPLVFPDSSMSTQAQWSSDYAGWHQRAQPHADPGAFTPTKDGLVLAVLRNAPVEHYGFTLAVFDGGDVEHNKVAVDAKGDVLVLGSDDFVGLKSLAEQVAELPDTGNFRNTWRLKSPVTSQPIDRILVRLGSGELKETGVQGFVKGKTELKSPEGSLPDVLSELTGLVLEGRDGYELGQEKPIVQRIKDILDAE